MYDALVIYRDYFKHLRIDKSQQFENGRVYINGIESFGVMRRSGCRNFMEWVQCILNITWKN